MIRKKWFSGKIMLRNNNGVMTNQREVIALQAIAPRHRGLMLNYSSGATTNRLTLPREER
jgi:hypothetical protein